mmetsp:Transcript_64118/g.134792  ORF Transcript_64118/g.134792 Transcript_64118/m.134792 type:complete len:679 (-) Transcript_64118:271-2307(-)
MARRQRQSDGSSNKILAISAILLLTAFASLSFLVGAFHHQFDKPLQPRLQFLDLLHLNHETSSSPTPRSPDVGNTGDGFPIQTRGDAQPAVPLLRKGSNNTKGTLTAPQNKPGDDLEDNAPRPPPRESDREVVSPVQQVLPGASATRLHGDLSSGISGELARPIPMPILGLTSEQKREAHKGQCFNAVKSDSLPLDRTQPDRRSSKCQSLHPGYLRKGKLPSASIVMVFHNEVASVLARSVHSVLNHSPPELVTEVILVDDCSRPDPLRFTEERWRRLQKPLEEHLMQLPKLKLVRLGERRGLMLARMEGAWRATGEVVIFLDSHIEATPGWIEPLLARVAEDYRHVVVPSIDSIEFDSFSYSGSSGLGILGFSWTLGQKPMAMKGDGASPQKSPIMAGGLFAAHRKFFLHLGGYDDGMRFYGGEEMEIGFRTWQCGGEIEFLPCSHVFHVFRDSTYWENTNSGGVAYLVPAADITRNKLRTAEVWMDEYATLVKYASPPIPMDKLGDLESRRKLREKLQCKPFRWYMENVVPHMSAPDASTLQGGAISSRAINGCVDNMGGNEPGLYPCHGQHGSQGYAIDATGMVRAPERMFEQCLTVSGSGEQRRLALRPCNQKREDMQWVLDTTTSQFWVKLDGHQRWCLEASKQGTERSPLDVFVVRCAEPPASLQQWKWKAW